MTNRHRATRLLAKLNKKLLVWFAGEDLQPRLSRWDWGRNAFSVVIGRDEIYWVSEERLKIAVKQSDWAEIETEVRQGVREWLSAKDWSWNHRDEETGHLFGITYTAVYVEEEPKLPGEQLFSVKNLTTGDGPAEVWGHIGAEPNPYQLQRLVDKART